MLADGPLDPRAQNGDALERLEQLSAAVLDGTPVDWDAEATGPAASYLDEIRALESLVQLQRNLAVKARDTPRTSSATPTPVLGEWGPLQLVERIGGGAFGEVFRAWDTRLDRQVALKLLYASKADHAQGATTIDEGRLLARVRHPNVVTVFGAERIEGRVGIWTEFVEGDTLAALVERHGRLTHEDATVIGMDLCAALAAVHGAGLVHGDVKADNVLQEPGGRIVLVDLGTGRERLHALRTRREISGTPLYMAPELWQGAEPTPRSDLYSLGVLLYFLVTGTHPVRGATLQEVREAHAAGRRVALRQERPDLPAGFRDVIDRALEPDPADRFDSAEAFRAALDRTRAASGRQRFTTFGRIIGSVTIAIGVAYGLIAWSRPASSGSTATAVRDLVSTRQLTSTSPETAVRTAALSPDGKKLAYMALNGLFVQGLPGGRAVRLEWPANVDVRDLTWNSDSTSLLVAGTDGVWTASATGAAPRRILDAASGIVPSPDGSLVALVRGPLRPGQGGSIWVATPDGDREWQVVEPRPRTGVDSPAWSPDGRRLAYAIHEQTRAGVRAAIESRRLDGTDPQVVLDGRGLFHLVWAPDGRILFTRPLPPPRARYTNWWQIRVDGRTGAPLEEARQITDFPDFNFDHPRLVADGRQLVFVRRRLRGDIVSADVDPAIPTLSGVRRVVFSSEDKLPSSWTPSGDALLFVANDRLYQQDLRETVARERPVGPGRVTHAAFSPDGTWLFYLLDRHPRPSALMRLPAGGGPAEVVDWQPHAPDPLRDTGPTSAWLNCSEWPADVCVVSDMVNGQLRLTTVDTVRGIATDLAVLPATPSYRGGWDLSPDGTRIASLDVSGGASRILVLDVRTRAVREVAADWLRTAQTLSWRGDGGGWFVTRVTGDVGSEVRSLETNGTSKVLWKSDAERLVSPTVSHDGRHVVFSSASIENDVWMLEGF